MAHWDGGDALIKRIEWAASAGRRISDRARPVELGEAILGPLFDDHTRTAVARAESSAQGLTLLLAKNRFAKTMLGNRYGEDGIGEGEAVLTDLAMHPTTAHFLAEKLVRHFVADEPPGELVSELARAYLDHDGELNAVYEALVSARTAWVEPSTGKVMPILMVLQLGDIVQTGLDPEWQMADAAFANLELCVPEVPYVVALGNHGLGHIDGDGKTDSLPPLDDRRIDPDHFSIQVE